jgi:hypothetical protein
VYVCEGTYAEHVKLTSPVSLYGGFACEAWTPSGTKVKVSPSAAGFALEVAGVKGDVTISDVSFVAANAVAKGESSIAAFVHNASKVMLVRSELEAGTGKEGDDGASGTTGAPTSGDLMGKPASGRTARHRVPRRRARARAAARRREVWAVRPVGRRRRARQELQTSGVRHLSMERAALEVRAA